MQNDDIFYGFGNKIELIRHIDSDWKSDVEKKKKYFWLCIKSRFRGFFLGH